MASWGSPMVVYSGYYVPAGSIYAITSGYSIRRLGMMQPSDGKGIHGYASEKRNSTQKDGSGMWAFCGFGPHPAKECAYLCDDVPPSWEPSGNLWACCKAIQKAQREKVKTTWLSRQQAEPSRSPSVHNSEPPQDARSTDSEAESSCTHKPPDQCPTRRTPQEQPQQTTSVICSVPLTQPYSTTAITLTVSSTRSPKSHGGMTS
ncbi:hypothetical protein N7519_010647 [Penicillium mononematosum]|uniref:uncharacterized protein n=1 Tax=Penicillium mononematosum TaxID=268346 RepID=UPI0025486D42|nr:uncharacterized protein N7519_010647 [Penicillium mononematosum]KAJ6180186.1 hypothetical protein N7519_010647 [Penicillium mononematosum]